jgi:hypothetical protein
MKTSAALVNSKQKQKQFTFYVGLNFVFVSLSLILFKPTRGALLKLDSSL